MSDTPNAIVQISRAQSDTDRICLTIISTNPKRPLHVRAEMTLAELADTLTTGVKVECDLVRFRIK